MKICTKCKTEKEIGEFHKRRASVDGLTPICKKCSYERGKQWNIENKEQVKENGKKYHVIHYTANRNEILERNKKWRMRNPEKHKEIIRKWRIKNAERVKEKNKIWYYENYDRLKDVAKKWVSANPERVKINRRRASAKIRSTLKGKINNCIAVAICRSLKGSKSYRKWLDIVGFTLPELMSHLEKQFQPGMTWENHGFYWHIDHKIPISVFNFEKSEDIDFRKCWSLKNLQPLEAVKNHIKKNKIDKPFQPSLLLQEVVNG